MDRRQLLLIGPVSILAPKTALAATREIWLADATADALTEGEIVLIDVRSRKEWLETGVATGAWPISMHEPRFEQRLFVAHEFSRGRPVALICATGGRSGNLVAALQRTGYKDFIDVSEGMLGSRRGPGWIARGLPITSLEDALSTLPEALQ